VVGPSLNQAPLQELADDLDGQLQRAGLLQPGVQPYGIWVLVQTLQTVRRFLLLGFELELYHHCELQMVFWYSECLCDLRLQLHAVCQKAAGVQATGVAAAAASGKKEKPGKKKNRGAEKGPQRPPVAGSPATRQEVLLCLATREVCSGLVTLLSLLQRLQFAPGPDLEFTHLSRRFEQRFGFLATLSRPAPLRVEQFREQREALARRSSDEIVQTALTAFKAAKSAVDQALHAPDGGPSPDEKAELTSLARVSVANSVLVASALKAPPPAGSRVATFSFATHPHFPLVKLEAAKPPAGGA